MVDYNASTLEEQVQEISDFVHNEADTAAKAVRMSLIMLILVSLILVVYFWILHSQVRQVTEPEELAKHAAVLIDENIPDIAGILENLLDDSAPQLADFISNQALDQGVPFMVAKSENFLTGYIDDMTKQTAGYMEKAFDDVLVTNKDSIEAAIKEEQTGDDPSNALRPLRDRMHATFTDQTTGKRTEAGEKIDKTLIALKNINTRLAAMAQKDPSDLNRTEQMGARLLRAHWNWMHHRKPEAAGTEASDEPVGHDL